MLSQFIFYYLILYNKIKGMGWDRAQFPLKMQTGDSAVHRKNYCKQKLRILSFLFSRLTIRNDLCLFSKCSYVLIWAISTVRLEHQLHGLEPLSGALYNDQPSNEETHVIFPSIHPAGMTPARFFAFIAVFTFGYLRCIDLRN